jgi:hypothetical protein
MLITYPGPHEGVNVTAIGQKAQRGVPIEVPDDVAVLLIRQGWQPAAPASSPLDELDKPALLELAATHGIDVSPRWGAPRLRAALADQITIAAVQVSEQSGDDAGL